MILITKTSDGISNMELGIELFCRDKIYSFNFIHLFHHRSEYHKIIDVTYRIPIIRNREYCDRIKGILYVID